MIGTKFSKEGDDAPQHRIAYAAKPHDDRGRHADCRVHKCNRREICRYIVFDLLAKIDDLPFVLKLRHDLDKTTQKQIFGNQ